MCEISEFDDTDFAKMYEALEASRQKKVLGLKNERAKKLSILSSSLLLGAFLNELGLKKEEIAFKEDEKGKPYLEGGKYHFSISHSCDLVCVLVSDRIVGVDNEKIRDVNLEVVNRCFTKNEKEYVLEENTNKRFFEIWTKKEAYSKMTGEGIKSFLSFDVTKEEILTIEYKDYLISVCVK